MATKYWIGGTGTWDNTNDLNWSTSSGGSNDTTHPTSGDAVILDAASGGGTVTLGADIDVASITMGAFTGTLDFGATNPTMATFNGSGTGVRTLNMGTGTWTITGNNATVWNVGTITNLTITGSGIIDCTYSGSTGNRTFAHGIGSSVPNNIKVSAGSDTFINNTTSPTYAGYLDFTGFTGVWNTGTFNLTGNLILGAGMTTTSGTNTLTLNSTTSQSITSNGVTIAGTAGGITQNGVGGTVTLNDNLSIVSTKTFTLTNGTFNANNYNVTCGIFSSSNSNTRTLTMGSGTWTLTGSGTNIWSVGTSTNFTLTSNTATINCTYSGGTGTRTFNSGVVTGEKYNNINITAGTDIFKFSVATTPFNNIDFSGFSGVSGGGSGTTVAIKGNLTFSPTMTCEDNATVRAWNFTGTTSDQILTTNGVILYHEVLRNSAPSPYALKLADDLDICGSSANSYQLAVSSGSFDSNNKNIKCSVVNSSTTNVRTISMGSGTWTLTGTGTVWNTATTTGLSLIAQQATIYPTSTSAVILSGGGTNYYKLKYLQPLSLLSLRNITFDLLNYGGARNIAQNRTQATTRSTASNRLAVRDMGTALRFGASVDDRVNIANSSSQVYDNESDVTICASFRIDAFGDYYIFSIPATAGANRKYISITASRKLSANLGNAGFGEILTTLQKGKPYQIILVCDHTNGRARAFVNGVQVKGWTDVTYGTGNADIVLGNVTTGKSLVGIADEYRIYGKLFTDQEAYDYYFNNIISQDNTLGEWTFDEGTGNTAYDTSGNGNNGTITGATYTTDVPFIPRSSI